MNEAHHDFKYDCTACGQCCEWGGYVCLLASDVPPLAAHLGLSVQDFVDRYTRHVTVEYTSSVTIEIVPYLILKSEGDRCVFLDGKLCKVHEAKPKFCAQSPITAEFLTDEEGWRVFSEQCPGFGKGRLYDATQIKEALLRQAQYDDDYELALEHHDWDLGKLLGVSLPEPELLPDFGVEQEVEEE